MFISLHKSWPLSSALLQQKFVVAIYANMPISFQAIVTLTIALTTNVVYKYPIFDKYMYLNSIYVPTENTKATTRRKVTRVYETQVFLIEGAGRANWTYRFTNEPSLIKETWANEELKYTWAPTETNTISFTNGTVLRSTTITITNGNLLYYENLLHAK